MNSSSANACSSVGSCRPASQFVATWRSPPTKRATSALRVIQVRHWLLARGALALDRRVLGVEQGFPRAHAARARVRKKSRTRVSRCNQHANGLGDCTRYDTKQADCTVPIPTPFLERFIEVRPSRHTSLSPSGPLTSWHDEKEQQNDANNA